MATNINQELGTTDFSNLIGGPLVAVINAQSLAAEATAKFIKEVGFYPDTTDANGKITVGSPIYVDFKYPKEIQPYQPGGSGTVTAAVVTTKGSGYTGSQAVTVTFTADTAKGETAATGTVKADPSGNIAAGTDITITSPGKYTSIPTASIEAPSGTGGTTAGATNITYIGSNPTPAVYQEMKISVPILTMLPIPFIKVDKFRSQFNAKITSMETSSSSTDTELSATVNAGYGGKRAYVSFRGSASYKKSNASGSSIERTYSMAIEVEASQDEMPAGMEKLLNILEGAMKSTPGNILPATTQ